MKNLRVPTLLLLGAAALAVLAYNAWSVGCGRCSVAILLNPGPTGYLLLGANFIFLLAFFAVRRSRRRTDRSGYCRCGIFLDPRWHFCPHCGDSADI